MAYLKSFDFNTLKKIAWEGDRHTNRQTDGHRDYLTESAQWADSVKTRQGRPC